MGWRVYPLRAVYRTRRGTQESSPTQVAATASIAFVWSAAKPLPCQMHWAWQSPAPKFRAEARTHLKLRLEKNMKKDIKFSTRMASADREKIRALAAKAHMSMSDYVTACCLGKRIVVIDEQKELLRQLKGIGSNINRLTVLANMDKVQVIGLDKAAQVLSEVSAALRAVMEGR